MALNKPGSCRGGQLISNQQHRFTYLHLFLVSFAPFKTELFRILCLDLKVLQSSAILVRINSGWDFFFYKTDSFKSRDGWCHVSMLLINQSSRKMTCKSVVLPLCPVVSTSQGLEFNLCPSPDRFFFFYLYSLIQSSGQHPGEGKGQGVDVVIGTTRGGERPEILLGCHSQTIWIQTRFSYPA